MMQETRQLVDASLVAEPLTVDLAIINIFDEQWRTRDDAPALTFYFLLTGMQYHALQSKYDMTRLYALSLQS